MQRPTARMPVIYLPHGGGPWPWTRPFTPQLGLDYVALRGYLEAIAAGLPQRPRAVVVISAHWEASVPTVMTAARPPMLYDYQGFPEDTYRIRWSAPGEPGLASRVRALLRAGAIDSAEDAHRGFDHGAFVPLKLAFPQAVVPTVQLSLDAAYDPAKHLAIGRALAPLRDEGVLLVGSGMSWEDFRADDIVRRSNAFDAWFREVGTATPSARRGPRAVDRRPSRAGRPSPRGAPPPDDGGRRRGGRRPGARRLERQPDGDPRERRPLRCVGGSPRAASRRRWARARARREDRR